MGVSCFAPGTTQHEAVENKNNLLSLLGIEPLFLGCAARSSSLYRLSYPVARQITIYNCFEVY
jgi:hypothetical protein